MTSAARGRAVGVVAVLLLVAAVPGGQRDGPGAHGGHRGRARDRRRATTSTTATRHADGHGANGAHDGCGRRCPPSGLEVLAEHAAHEHGHRAPRTTAGPRPRASAGPSPGSLCAGGYELPSATGPAAPTATTSSWSGAPPLLGGAASERHEPQLGLGRLHRRRRRRATACS